MTKWEYMCCQVKEDQPEALQDTLDTFGATGWELVSVVVSTSSQDDTTCLTAFLKRPL